MTKSQTTYFKHLRNILVQLCLIMIKTWNIPLFCVWSFANCMWLFTNIFKHKIRFFRKQTYHPYGYFFLTAVSWSIMKCGHGVLSNQIVSLCVLISMHYLMILSRSRSITERKKNKWSFHIFAKTFLRTTFLDGGQVHPEVCLNPRWWVIYSDILSYKTECFLLSWIISMDLHVWFTEQHEVETLHRSQSAHWTWSNILL